MAGHSRPPGDGYPRAGAPDGNPGIAVADIDWLAWSRSSPDLAKSLLFSDVLTPEVQTAPWTLIRTWRDTLAGSKPVDRQKELENLDRGSRWKGARN